MKESEVVVLEKKKSARELVQILNSSTSRAISEVSPTTARSNLKQFLKLPMVLWLFVGGLHSGLSLACFKYASEFLIEPKFEFQVTLVATFAILGGLFALFGLVLFLNTAMKYFE